MKVETYVTEKDIEQLKNKGYVEFEDKGIKITLKYLKTEVKAQE